MLWEIDIHPSPGQRDLLADHVRSEAADLQLAEDLQVATARGYLIQGELDAGEIARVTESLLVDGVVECTVAAPLGDASLNVQPLGLADDAALVHVLPKPGVTDPVAESALRAVVDLQIEAEAVRTFNKYWLCGLNEDQLQVLCSRSLANDAIEQIVIGPLKLDRLQLGSSYEFRRIIVPLLEIQDDAELARLSREQQLYLSIAEMRTIQAYFRKLERNPTDAELETLAQTWSEHCSHKTLKGRIRYRDEQGERTFDNMLKETIFAATERIRRELGEQDWCVSVFEDNAGIVRFDDQYNIVFKVETHNHPSAIEPYGGANTGVGGVIRDTLGAGLGAKPICNTDVFCFAPPDMPAKDVPPGALHPKRVMKGVVAGVRDYGNRMGIPTVNGAIFFDPRYLGNPLVYCGNVGLIPRDKSTKKPQPNDWIVAVGGRTGRDGMHGATFSSTELTSESESISGGSVQIGDAVTEKMVADVILAARDRGLYNAITDCGAGGFSSAVGEMGETIGAEVQLEAAPLKYEGLSYTEIWISEAQERMVLSVSPDRWDELSELCQSEGVEATVIGRFVPTGRLQLKYHDEIVADLSMKFLHDGRPPVVREAVYSPPESRPLTWPAGSSPEKNTEHRDFTDDLLLILGSLNVASKEWVIRQYDHEVQGGSVIKPLVGETNDGPGDAAVIRPVLGSQRGVVIACGMNPRYGDLDPYQMAASALDEAVRNCVAVGADPSRIAVLDNFCWGSTDRPEQLGSLVRAATACHDVAVVLGTPFISGKDSLNNEFHYADATGRRCSIAIPPSLLISAMGQIADVRRAVTMDFKSPGNFIYQIGATKNELGGSHFALVNELSGGQAPRVDAEMAKQTFAALHQAIDAGLVRACHDMSEGGLAVAVAEMAFAGGWGAAIALDDVPSAGDVIDLADSKSVVPLFSESNTRFLCEVTPDNSAAFEKLFQCAESDKRAVPHQRIGEVTANGVLEITSESAPVVRCEIARLKEAWQAPLRWK